MKRGIKDIIFDGELTHIMGFMLALCIILECYMMSIAFSISFLLFFFLPNYIVLYL